MGGGGTGNDEEIFLCTIPKPVRKKKKKIESTSVAGSC